MQKFYDVQYADGSLRRYVLVRAESISDIRQKFKNYPIKGIAEVDKGFVDRILKEKIPYVQM